MYNYLLHIFYIVIFLIFNIKNRSFPSLIAWNLQLNYIPRLNFRKFKLYCQNIFNFTIFWNRFIDLLRFNLNSFQNRLQEKTIRYQKIYCGTIYQYIKNVHRINTNLPIFIAQYFYLEILILYGWTIYAVHIFLIIL